MVLSLPFLSSTVTLSHVLTDSYHRTDQTKMTMTLQDFLAQCDDATLDYIEESLLPKLIEVDKLYKMQSQVADLRNTIAEATK